MEQENTKLEELKAEAKALGIKFNPKIGEDKLSQKIEDHYNSLSAEDSVKSVDNKIDDNIIIKPMDKTVETKEAKFRKQLHETKRKAMAKRVVTLSSNDKRDSEYTTTAYLSMENQYFGVSKLVPLDIPVELEECLIDVAKTTYITLHKDEVVNGRRTGNKVPVRTRKYNVSYEEIK